MNENYEDRSGNGAFICGLLTGVTLGAGLAMLFAPKPGSELRRDLAAGASDLGQAAKDTWQDIATTATDAVQKGREVYDQARGTVQDVADSASRSMDRVKAAVKDSTTQVASQSGSSFAGPAGDGSRF
jgi:gas vesicle protein